MKSSGDSRTPIASRRSRDVKRRRKKKRPSSSRLAKRGKPFQFDLIDEKASDGEEIATIQGGSTSRENQYSHRALGTKFQMGFRLSSDQGGLEANPLSLPDLHKDTRGLITDTGRSYAAHLVASSRRSRDRVYERFEREAQHETRRSLS